MAQLIVSPRDARRLERAATAVEHWADEEADPLLAWLVGDAHLIVGLSGDRVAVADEYGNLIVTIDDTRGWEASAEVAEDRWAVLISHESSATLTLEMPDADSARELAANFSNED